jgi:hypothetical protein
MRLSMQRRTRNRIIFAKGHGTHMTDGEILQAVADQKQAKLDKEARKAERAARWGSMKLAKEAAETRWKVIVAEHEVAVEAWKVGCEKLRSEGVRAKNLPAKPKRPPKPKPVVEPAEERDDEGEEDEEEDKEDNE